MFDYTMLFSDSAGNDHMKEIANLLFLYVLLAYMSSHPILQAYTNGK
jgi:hypothetical protein